MTGEIINEYNSRILDRLSFYLNFRPSFINKNLINELIAECELTKEEAFGILLAEGCGMDILNSSQDMRIYTKYFPDMIYELNIDKYKNNPYYKNINIESIKGDNWKFEKQNYKPFEAFVFNDLKNMNDGRIIPQIGFFPEEFYYPAVLQNNRVWMLVTPNEIETMQNAVNKARGNVLTYGLGLGYFAYMASIKDDVSSVTIVERDKEIIDLFKKYILPQFKCKDKVKILQYDAFFYAENYMSKGKYDLIFTDLWHDPSDGVDLYLKMKDHEKYSPHSTFMYWIEKTIKYYITSDFSRP